MTERFYAINNGTVEETDSPSGYRVIPASQAAAAEDAANGRFVGEYDPDETTRAWPEQCICEVGLGGCKQEISLTCSPDAVAACIQTIADSCDR